MKIRVIDRIVLFLLALIALITGVCAALNEFGISVLALLAPHLALNLTDTAALILRIVGIAVLVLLSVYLFSVSFRRKKKPDPFINMESGNKGSIRMSMDSISSLVLQTCSKVPGLSGLKVATINHEDSVSVDLAFQVEMNRNIPELSAQLQQVVGEAVERNCGVAVRNVCVTVSGFTPATERPALPSSKGKKAERHGWFRKERDAEPIPAVSAPVPEPEVTAAEEAPLSEEAPEAEAVSEELPVAPEIPEEPEAVVVEPVPEEPVSVPEETADAEPEIPVDEAQEKTFGEAADEALPEDEEAPQPAEKE